MKPFRVMKPAAIAVCKGSEYRPLPCDIKHFKRYLGGAAVGCTQVVTRNASGETMAKLIFIEGV
jgi:hypothetical protein